MKYYIRACAFALLFPLFGAASAQETNDERPAKEKSKTVAIQLEGGHIKVFMPSDPDAVEKAISVVKRLDLGEGMGSIVVYRGDEAGEKYLLEFTRSAQASPGFIATGNFGAASVDLIDDTHLNYTLETIEGVNPQIVLSTRPQGLRIRGIGSAKQRRALAELEEQSRSLGRKAREAEGQEREELEEQLRSLLHEVFDLKVVMRVAEVESLQEKINDANEIRAERESNRDAIIQQRLDKLLGRSSKFDW